MNKIKQIETRFHNKASEKYVDVNFSYADDISYLTSVPISYRRTGTEIPDDELDTYLQKVYEEVNPINWNNWRSEQCNFWSENKPNALTTKSFFDVLSQRFDWCCTTCTLPPNPNFARRIQDIKEFGYTLATNINKFCSKCNKNTNQIILLPIKRGGITGYEIWSPQLRAHIVEVLASFDAYEAKVTRKEGLLPDHHFPEIRWDADTKRDSSELESISDDEIRRDFQLISNQRNQQKREVCRNCFQTGNRGVIYGISFFYSGTTTWDEKIKKTGKEAEKGCVGCGWYDINQWRLKLNEFINSIK